MYPKNLAQFLAGTRGTVNDNALASLCTLNFPKSSYGEGEGEGVGEKKREREAGRGRE